MRIPYPERISYTGAFIFAAGLSFVQVVQHTPPAFSVCCFAYIMAATAAFNIAGGLYRPAGAYIFFNAVLTLIIGVVTKAALGEAANTNLAGPQKAIEVYFLGMVSLLVAAFVESRIRPRQGFASRAFPLLTLRGVYLGAMLIGVPSSLFWLTAPTVTAGSFLIAFRNTDQLIPFALILGVMYNARASNGRRSMTPLLLLVFVYLQLYSLITFSRQFLFTPAFCWLLGAGLSRYKLKPINYICLSLTFFVLYFFGAPYVGVGKLLGNVSGSNLRLRIAIAADLIENMGKTRADYKADVATEYLKINYYNQGEGVLDRLEMFSIDALLIQTADENGYFGFEPTKEGWENVVPHLIWKNKPIPYFGNYYAHFLGLVGDDDDTTGVSFGVTADSYFQGGLYGVLVIQTLCFTAIFSIFSFLVGDVRDHPAVILLILMEAHVAPEGMMPGAIGLILFCAVVIGFAFFCRYIFPLVSNTFLPEPLPPPLVPAAFAAD
jgi:hypothetical protein